MTKAMTASRQMGGAGREEGGRLMTSFSARELAYLQEGRRLGRVATVGRDGTPHVVPVAFRYNPEHDSIDIGGFNFERTKKYRDVERTGRAAFVVDDVVSSDPWRARGIEIRGRAEALVGDRPKIRIYPEWIGSWGLETEVVGQRRSRAVA